MRNLSLYRSLHRISLRRFALLTPVVVLTTMIGAARAQSCIYVPDNRPDQGASSFVPFGNASTTDPAWSACTLQIFVPKSKLGTNAQLITSIAFAPVSSRTRVLGDFRIGLKQTDKTASQLESTFANNASGGGAAFEFHDVEMPVTANTWVHFPVRYLVRPTRSLILSINASSVGSTGSGDAGFRTDPTMDVVYAPTARATQGKVMKGGPKIMICFRTGFIQVFEDAGCVGSNNKQPRLDISGGYKPGQSFTVRLDDAPPTNLAIFVMGLKGFTNQLDLTAAGAPGCALRTTPHFVVPGATVGGKAAVPLQIPNSSSVVGAELAFQWFPYDPTANAFLLTSSNWGFVQIGY